MIRKLLSSSLFRSAGIYTLSNIVNAAVPFLLIPIFTRYLMPSDYGIISMFQVMVGVMGPLISLSIHGAIGRQYVDKNLLELSEYIANCFLLIICSGLICCLVFFLFTEQIATVTSIQNNWLWTVIIFVFSQTFIQVLLSVWQMQGKAKHYAFLSFTQTICNAALSIFAIVQLEMGWEGRIKAQVITSILFAIIAMAFMVKHNLIKPKYNKTYMLSALSFGLPLIPHALGSWATNMIDKVFITNLVGVSETGIYSVGYQIGMIISILEASFIQAWVPYLYKDLKENTFEIKCKLVKFTYIYCISLAFIALLVSFSAKYIMPIFVGNKFIVAEQFIIWIASGYAFNGMYKMMAGYFFYFEKTMVLAKITASSSIINIILTYSLILKLGTIGAAYATTCSFFITFIMTWCLVNRVNKMPWFSFYRKGH